MFTLLARPQRQCGCEIVSRPTRPKGGWRVRFVHFQKTPSERAVWASGRPLERKAQRGTARDEPAESAAMAQVVAAALANAPRRAASDSWHLRRGPWPMRPKWCRSRQSRGRRRRRRARAGARAPARQHRRCRSRRCRSRRCRRPRRARCGAGKELLGLLSLIQGPWGCVFASLCGGAIHRLRATLSHPSSKFVGRPRDVGFNKRLNGVGCPQSMNAGNWTEAAQIQIHLASCQKKTCLALKCFEDLKGMIWFEVVCRFCPLHLETLLLHFDVTINIFGE